MSQFVLFPTEEPDAQTGLSVGPVDWLIAGELIRENHYLHRAGSCSEAFGLQRENEIVGVLTYGTIMRKNAAAICGEEWADRVYELTRLWVRDAEPRNTESWFIAKTFRLLNDLRPHVAILISYADSAFGHAGTIYQATNWLYTGYSTKGSFVDEDGERIHARTLRDSRRGATVETTGSYRWLANEPRHRYVRFQGDKRQRKRLRTALRWPVLPYPKLGEHLCEMCEEYPSAERFCARCIAYFGDLLQSKDPPGWGPDRVCPEC